MATTFRLKRKLFAGFGAAVGNMFGRSNFQNISKANSFGKNLWEGTKGVTKAVGSSTLAVGGLTAAGVAGTSALAKKAGEQSDGKSFKESI